MSDRGRSRSRSPRRDEREGGRGGRDEGEGGGRATRYRPEGVSLLIRNLPHDARPEEVRKMFERFGEVKDVYLPRDYYSQRPKGFGFIELSDPRDADEALARLDGTMVGDRRVEVVRSQQSRKTPREMVHRDRDERRGGGGGGGGRRYDDRDRGGYDRRGGGGGYDRDRDRGRDYGGGRDRDRPRGGYDRSGRDRSRSPDRRRGRSRSAGRRRAASPPRGSRSPVAARGRSRSASPAGRRRGSGSRSASPGIPRGGRRAGGARDFDREEGEEPMRAASAGAEGGAASDGGAGASPVRHGSGSPAEASE